MHDDEKISSVDGYTKKIAFGCGNLYITVNLVDGKPFRVFLRLGKAGVCQGALLESIARLSTIMIQDYNAPLERICHTLKGIRCENGAIGRISCVDALARELEKMIAKPEAAKVETETTPASEETHP